MRILIVEDDLSLQANLAQHLQQAQYSVDVASDGEDGLFQAQETLFDAAIIDVGLPKIDGISLIEQLRQQGISYPILILTARDGWQDKVKGLDAGADDYLTKPFSVEELNLRIKSLLKRVNIRTEIPEEKVFNVSEFVFDTENLTLTLGGNVQSLTKKEAQILKILYKFKNQVLPREVILNTVWGQDDYFVGRSLDVFITKLRKYLKDDETIQILNIHGVGFKLEIKA